MVSVEQHFVRVVPAVAAIYRRLLTKTQALGPFTEVPNKSSIHLVNRTIFADIRSRRVERHDQVSANRWHLRIRLSEPAEIDRELLGWLKAAYTLAG